MTAGAPPLTQQVAYRSRDLQDRARIEEFLTTQRIGVLGLAGDDGYPYAVPVNYVWHEGAVWLHGMGSGKRQRLLAATGPDGAAPRVCFTVFRDDGTVPDPVACHADTAYLSVIVFGTAVRVTDHDEAAAALRLVVAKFLPEHTGAPVGGRLVEAYRSALDGNAVSVHRIVPDQITAKENR